MLLLSVVNDKVRPCWFHFHLATGLVRSIVAEVPGEYEEELRYHINAP